MFKTTFFIVLFFFAHLVKATEASSFYQIDLIVFTYQQASLLKDLSLSSTLSSSNANTIPLQTEVSKNRSPYHLLPSSSSQLREEYWALHRKPQYQVLLHYTWLQPMNNQHAIALPKIQHEGWEIEGTLRVQRSNYYLLDSELLISAPGNKDNPYVLTQRQRSKGGNIYYLDHPQAGMIIKVHQLATA
ncbi:MAG: hypothetical protein H0T84_08780 [Tatlockia sp.]|nr:hypothetical protein [Tatlockia sp.]